MKEGLCFSIQQATKDILKALNKKLTIGLINVAIQQLRETYKGDEDNLISAYESIQASAFLSNLIHSDYVSNSDLFAIQIKTGLSKKEPTPEPEVVGPMREAKEEAKRAKSDFLNEYFGLNSSARQAFKLLANEEIVSQLFLGEVEGGFKFITNTEELNKQIRSYQQGLVNKILEYLQSYEKELYQLVKDFHLYEGEMPIERFFEILTPFFTDQNIFKQSLSYINKGMGIGIHKKRAEVLPAWILLRHFDDLLKTEFKVINIALGLDNVWVNDDKKYSINFASNNVTSWDDGTKDFDPIDELGNINSLFIQTMHEYDYGSNRPRQTLMKVRDFYLARNKQWEMAGSLFGKQTIFNPDTAVSIDKTTLYETTVADVIHQEFDDLFGEDKVNTFIDTYRGQSLSRLLALMNKNSRFAYPIVYFFMLLLQSIPLNMLEKRALQSIYMNVFSPKNPKSLLCCSLKSNPLTVQRDYYTAICQMLRSANPNTLLEYEETFDGGISSKSLSQNTRDKRRNELLRFIQGMNFMEGYPPGVTVTLEAKGYKVDTTEYPGNKWLTITYTRNDVNSGEPITYIIEKMTAVNEFRITKKSNTEERVIFKQSVKSSSNISILSKEDFSNLCGLLDSVMPLNFGSVYSPMSNTYFGDDLYKDENAGAFSYKAGTLIKFVAGILHSKAVSEKLKNTPLSEYNKQIKEWFGANAPKRMKNLKAVEILSKTDFPILLALSEARDITDGIFGDNVVSDGAGKQIATSGNQLLSTSVQTQFETIRSNPEHAAYDFSLYDHYKSISWMRDYKGADGTVKSATDFNSSELFLANFIYDFYGSRDLDGDDASILIAGPVVSDKPKPGKLVIGSNREYDIVQPNGLTVKKKITDCTKDELKGLIRKELGAFYKKSFNIIKEDWKKIETLINLDRQSFINYLPEGGLKTYLTHTKNSLSIIPEHNYQELNAFFDDISILVNVDNTLSELVISLVALQPDDPLYSELQEKIDKQKNKVIKSLIKDLFHESVFILQQQGDSIEIVDNLYGHFNKKTNLYEANPIMLDLLVRLGQLNPNELDYFPDTFDWTSEDTFWRQADYQVLVDLLQDGTTIDLLDKTGRWKNNKAINTLKSILGGNDSAWIKNGRLVIAKIRQVYDDTEFDKEREKEISSSLRSNSDYELALEYVKSLFKNEVNDLLLSNPSIRKNEGKKEYIERIVNERLIHYNLVNSEGKLNRPEIKSWYIRYKKAATRTISITSVDDFKKWKGYKNITNPYLYQRDNEGLWVLNLGINSVTISRAIYNKYKEFRDLEIESESLDSVVLRTNNGTLPIDKDALTLEHAKFNIDYLLDMANTFNNIIAIANIGRRAKREAIDLYVNTRVEELTDKITAYKKPSYRTKAIASIFDEVQQNFLNWYANTNNSKTPEEAWDAYATKHSIDFSNLESFNLDNLLKLYALNEAHAKYDLKDLLSFALTKEEELNKITSRQTNIELNPEISKLNLIHYFYSLEYLDSTVGSHINHPFKRGKKLGEIEAEMFGQQTKRNVSYTATKYGFIENTLRGLGDDINIAILEEIDQDVFNFFGDAQNVSVYNGATFVYGAMSLLENESLGNQAVGVVKKEFVHDYKKTGTGVIVKTAGFPITNLHIRNSKFHARLNQIMGGSLKWEHRGDTKGWLEIRLKDGSVRYVFDWTKTWNGGKISILNTKDPIYYKASNGKHYGVIPSSIYVDPATGETHFILFEVASESKDGFIAGRRISLVPLSINFGIIDNNYDLWRLFGGAWSEHIGTDPTGRSLLTYENDELSFNNLVECMNLSCRLREDVRDEKNPFGPKFNTFVPSDMSDVSQPLKSAMIAYIPTEEAVKQGCSNINSRLMLTDPNYHVTTMKLSNWDNGVQLDAEHLIDNSLLTLMTLVVNALGARGYSAIEAQEVYDALYLLTVSNLDDLLTGLQSYIKNPQEAQDFKEAVAKMIIKSLKTSSTTDGDLINAIAIQLRDWDGLLGYQYLKDKLPISHPEVFKKIISNIASALKKKAIRIQFPGSMSVLNPSDGFIKVYGGRLLSEYGNELSENGVPKSLVEKLAKLPPLVNPDKTIAVHKIRLGTTYKVTINQLESFISDPNELIQARRFFKSENIVVNDPPTYWKLKKYIDLGCVHEITENIIDGRDLACLQYAIADTNGKYYNVWDLDIVKDKWYWLTRRSISELPLTDLEFATLRKYGYNGELELKSIRNFLQVLLLKTLNAIGSGNEGSVFIDGNKVFIDKTKTKVAPYEAIGGKMMKTEFGLLDGDSVGAIVEDKKFFVKRLLQNRKNRVPSSLFDVALKSPNGNHTYIQFDDGEHPLSNDGLFKVNFDYRQDADGNWYRIDANRNNMYQIPMKLNSRNEWVPDCEVYTNGAFEIIRTNKISHFLEKTSFWNITLSPELIKKNTSQFLHLLASCNKKPAKRLLFRLCRDEKTLELIQSRIGQIELEIDEITEQINAYKYEELTEPDVSYSEEIERLLKQLSEKQQEIEEANNITELELNNPENLGLILYLDKKENEAILKYLNSNTLEGLEKSCLRNAIEEGTKMYTSFLSSLKVIASRTPAQSHQSFMAMVFVGFDNSDKNNVFVSRWQLWLQGSDYDIDKGNLLTRNYSNGLLLTWSNLMSLESEELLEASETIPFPKGQDLELTDEPEQQDSVFKCFERPLEVGSYTDDSGHLVTNYQYNDNPNALFLVTRLEGNVYQCLLILNGNTLLNYKEKFIMYNTLEDVLPKDAKLILIDPLNFEEEWLNKAGFNNQDGLFVNTKLINKETQLIDFMHSFFESPADLNILNQDTIFNPNLQPLKAHVIRSIATVIRTINRMKAVPNTEDELCVALFKIINSHNQYLNQLPKGKNKAIQNFISTYMFRISSDPVNLIQGQSPIDAISDIIKAFADEQPLAEKAKQFNTKAITSTFNLFVLTQAGKKNVGIVASAMKVLEAMGQFYNTVLNFGGEDEQKRLMVARLIMDKTYNFIANTYAKNFSNVTEELREALLQVDNINDAFIWMSGVLTLATDNAKDPTLAKINAGPEMISLYTAGLTLGVPFEDLVTIIASDTGRIILKIQRGNVFNDELPLHNLDAAIRYINTGPRDASSDILAIVGEILKARGELGLKGEVTNFTLKKYLAGNGFPDLIAKGRSILNTIKKLLYSEDVEEELKDVILKTSAEYAEDLIKLTQEQYRFKNYEKLIAPFTKTIKDCKDLLTTLRGAKGLDKVQQAVVTLQIKALEKTLKSAESKLEKLTKFKEQCESRISNLQKLVERYNNNDLSDLPEELIPLDGEVTTMHEAASLLTSAVNLNIAKARERHNKFKDRIGKLERSRKNNLLANLQLKSIKEQQINSKLVRAFVEEWEHYLDYLEIINKDTYYNEEGKRISKFKDIQELNYFNKEMGALRNILALNLDYPNSADEAIAWVKDFEQIIINRLLDVPSSSLPDDLKQALMKANKAIFKVEDSLKVSLTDFVNNTECGYPGGYRKLVLDVYDKIKYKVNVLDVAWGVSHYRGYLTGMAILYNASKLVAVAYRMVDKLSTEVVMQKMKVNPKSKDMAKYNKKLSKFVSHKINQLWFQSIQYTIPITKDGETVDISLSTDTGRQMFKQWMDTVVFPNLKVQNKTNAFVKHLTLSPYSFNPRHNTTINYTSGINALPRSDRELDVFTLVKQGLNNLRTYTLDEKGNIKLTGDGRAISDLIFLYNMIAYDGQPGLSSFTSLFEDFITLGGGALIDGYKAFISNLDFNSNFFSEIDYTDDEVQRFIAPEITLAALRTSASSKVPGIYAWVQDMSTLQWHLIRKIPKEDNSQNEDDLDDFEMSLMLFSEEDAYQEDEAFFGGIEAEEMIDIEEDEDVVKIQTLLEALEANKKWEMVSNFDSSTSDVLPYSLNTRLILNDANISIVLDKNVFENSKIIVGEQIYSLSDLVDIAKANGKDIKKKDLIVFKSVKLRGDTNFIQVVDKSLTEQRIKEALLKCN